MTTRIASTVRPIGARRVVDLPLEERLALYPDARRNFRPTMYGLTLAEYRAEWCRCRDAGWQPWELAARFPAPEVVAA